MSVSAEQIANQEQQLCLAELPNSQVAAHEILQEAEPLRDDPLYRAEFYEEMGVVRTPLLEVDSVNGSQVLVKPEYWQDMGAYKRRGATNAVMTTEAETIVTCSTGNHAQAVLRAGQRRGKHVVIEVTTSISPAKEAPLAEGVRNGDVELHYHETFRDAQIAADAREGEPGVAVVGPFGHDKVVAGQLSAGFELVEDLQARGLAHANVIIPVPAAGLGYLMGITLPIRDAQARGELGPHIRIVAVQPVDTDAAGRAVAKIQAGEEPVDLFLPGELDKDCDALAITEESLNARNLAIAADTNYVDSFETIDKLSMAKARRYLSDQLGVEVEPAAALPMAYAMAHATGDEVFVLPVTGKNISKETQKLYDGLVIDEYVQQFQAASKADLARSDKQKDRQIVAPMDTTAVRGVWRSRTTREYVGDKPVRETQPKKERPAVNRKLALLAGATTRAYVTVEK